PCDDISIAGAFEARGEKLILPVLVGPTAKIRAAAAQAKVSLDGIDIVDTPHSHAAAEKAVELARAGSVEAVMIGAMHTEEVIAAVVRPDTGLRNEGRVSHVFVLDVSTYAKPLLVTDAAINIYPTLDDKRDIVQNAIDLAKALGVETPKVAIL